MKKAALILVSLALVFLAVASAASAKIKTERIDHFYDSTTYMGAPPSQVTISGTISSHSHPCEIGRKVMVKEGDSLVGTATTVAAGANGRFSLDPISYDFRAAGVHSLTVRFAAKRIRKPHNVTLVCAAFTGTLPAVQY